VLPPVANLRSSVSVSTVGHCWEVAERHLENGYFVNSALLCYDFAAIFLSLMLLILRFWLLWFFSQAERRPPTVSINFFFFLISRKDDVLHTNKII
jgi:hypothetical protein